MKKEYIKPYSEIVNMETTSMMATSVMMTDEAAQVDYEGGGDVNDFKYDGFNIWD